MLKKETNKVNSPSIAYKLSPNENCKKKKKGLGYLLRRLVHTSH